MKNVVLNMGSTSAYYLVRKLCDEPKELDRLFMDCVNTLDNDYLFAQYGEPLKIKASSFIDKSYFEQKLRYYMTDIFEYLKDDFFIPEYCYQSLIKSPLSNELEVSDDDFYSRFYEIRIKQIIVLLDYSYNNPKEFDNIYFELQMELDITDELDKNLFEKRQKQLNEQLLEKIISDLGYEISQDFRNYLCRLEI